MIDNIIDQLKRDEGLRLMPYNDTRGFLTIGFGHNLDANPLPYDVSNGISIDTATALLEADIAHVTAKLLYDMPWVDDLAEVYKGVLINMSFNMGVAGEEAFHHMNSDLQAGNFLQAAKDGTNSLWYTQVGLRAQRLMTQLSTGVWQ
jgi:lysozyme